MISVLFARFWRTVFSISMAVSISYAQHSSKLNFIKHAASLVPAMPIASGEVLHTEQGFNMRVWLGNNATMGRGAFVDFNPSNNIGLEYPVGSGIEHLYGAGPWLGAIIDTGHGSFSRLIPAVTTGYGGRAGGFTGEMFGYQTESDTFYRTSIFKSNVPNRRFYDDDNDGRIDEDDLDGVDNDGDGFIDEDYAAVSESDVYVSYTDTFHSPIVQGHIPLGIKVWQKSYAWGSRVKEPIIVIEYNLKPLN